MNLKNKKNILSSRKVTKPIKNCWVWIKFKSWPLFALFKFWTIQRTHFKILRKMVAIPLIFDYHNLKKSYWIFNHNSLIKVEYFLLPRIMQLIDVILVNRSDEQYLKMCISCSIFQSVKQINEISDSIEWEIASFKHKF